MKPAHALLILLTSCSLLLGGCGQKGPLYLPQPDPATAPATADDNSESAAPAA